MTKGSSASGEVIPARHAQPDRPENARCDRQCLRCDEAEREIARLMRPHQPVVSRGELDRLTEGGQDGSLTDTTDEPVAEPAEHATPEHARLNHLPGGCLRTTSVPWDDIDPGIAGVVRAFIEAGFETIASCQGHGSGDAWVAVLPSYRDGATPRNEDALLCALDVERLLYNAGWDKAATVSIKWVVTREPVRDYFIEARWWGEVPFR